MLVRPTRLGLKLMLITLVALLALATATGALVTRGLRQTQREVTRRSAEGLELQGRDSLSTLVGRETEITAAALQRGAAASQQAALYLSTRLEAGGGAPAGAGQLIRGFGGQWLDPDPARRSNVFIPNSVTTLDGALERDLRESAALDAIFPTLLAGNGEVSAIYYVTPRDLIRSYPTNEAAKRVPPDHRMTEDPSYRDAAPDANPGRRTVWRRPYTNPSAQDVLVTASTPVYLGDEFRGVVAVDIALDRLIARLNALKPTPSGYAFLMDGEGRLVAASTEALRDLTGLNLTGSGQAEFSSYGVKLAEGAFPDLRVTLEAMRAGARGVDRIDLNGRAVFVAYAPLEDIGWRLALVAPLGEITAHSTVVAAAIRDDADRTVASTLAAMAVIFLLALVATTLISHRLLTRPIAALVAGTRAVGAGDLRVVIPVKTRDELGILAGSFNQMTTQLATTRERLEDQAAQLTRAYELLEQRVAERTRELSTLLDISHTVASTLELQPLLRLILDGLKAVVDYTAVAIYTLEDRALVTIEYRGPVPRDVVLGTRLSLEDVESVWECMARGEPVIVDDLHEEPHRRHLFRALGEQAHAVLASTRSRMYVPLLRKERAIGMLSVSHAEPRRYTAQHVRLTQAIASQAAVAIENARLYSALQEHLAQVEGLSAVGTALVEERDLQRVLRTVGERVLELVGAGGCAIALLDPDQEARLPGEELELVVVVGTQAERLTGRRLPLVGSFAGEAIRRGTPLVTEDAQQDPRGFLPTVQLVGITSFLAVPLQTSERTVGALNVYNPRGRHFGPRDIEIMTVFAQQAAVAIENARLYQQGRELAVAEERNRMAREIHDTLAQGFTGIILQLEVAQALLDAEPAVAQERLRTAQDLARTSLQEARRSVRNLRPAPLQGRTLAEALRAHLDEWARATGIATDFTLNGAPRPLASEIEVALLRIAQEALHNVYKHAAARRVEVMLAFRHGAMQLRICDDGIGFNGSGRWQDGGFGLVSMRERAGRIGGKFSVSSVPGQGTRVRVTVPLGEVSSST